MNKTKMATIGVSILILTPLIVLGASTGYKAMALNMAEKAWNYSNSNIASLESELALERKKEVESFCFLVETKKDQSLSISETSLKRYDKDCSGL